MPKRVCRVCESALLPAQRYDLRLPFRVDLGTLRFAEITVPR